MRYISSISKYIAVLLFTPVSLFGQSKILLSMDRAIYLAHNNSIQSMIARNVFLGDYWNFRAFKASELPSLNFRADIAEFDRSQRPLQNYETGEINYRANYNMYNTGSISIDQNIFSTGGQLSLYSSLSRLDQWKPSKEKTYYTQPVTLSYIQPLWTYNSFKWDKKIEPERYEKSKKEYLEAMESVTITAVSLFYDMLTYKMNYDLAVSNYKNTISMYNIASQRIQIGSVKKAELLQLELRMLNDSLSINTYENDYESKKIMLKSFLGLDEKTDIELIVPGDAPDIVLDHDLVLNKALENSSFVIDQKVNQLESEREVARAKGNRGISAQITSRFGLSNNDEKLKKAYGNLKDQEVVKLSLSVPIMDWGMGKGRVKVAKANLETTQNRIDQAMIDYRQEILIDVMKFNSQRAQCEIAKRASSIAEERYDITMANFANGTISVMELNTAQSEKDQAVKSYIDELYKFWKSYYTLRKVSLYDFINKKDISAEFDNLVK